MKATYKKIKFWFSINSDNMIPNDPDEKGKFGAFFEMSPMFF